MSGRQVETWRPLDKHSPRENFAKSALVERARPGFFARGGVAMVRWYQRYLSPLKPPVCRFHPSCSQYTLEAIERYGLIRGSFMGAARIMRCNPFHPGGYDPVP